MALFTDSAKNTFIGVIFVIIAIVFLLSGLDVLRIGWMGNRYFIISEQFDVLIAFALIVIGLGYIFSEVGKPGKPKYEVTLGEQTLTK